MKVDLNEDLEAMETLNAVVVVMNSPNFSTRRLRKAKIWNFSSWKKKRKIDQVTSFGSGCVVFFCLICESAFLHCTAFLLLYSSSILAEIHSAFLFMLAFSSRSCVDYKHFGDSKVNKAKEKQKLIEKNYATEKHRSLK